MLLRRLGHRGHLLPPCRRRAKAVKEKREKGRRLGSKSWTREMTVELERDRSHGLMTWRAVGCLKGSQPLTGPRTLLVLRFRELRVRRRRLLLRQKESD